jgi:hypothetical protein
MRSKLLSVASLLLAGLALLPACDDAVRPGGGCLTDDDCAGARVCVRGYCVDPDGGFPDDADAGSGDVALDIGSDVSVDVIDVPPPPPARGCLEASEPRLDFGVLEAGQETARRLTLSNCGRIPVRLDAVVVADDAGVFAHRTPPPGPQELPPGAALDVVIRAAPPAAGGFLGALIATSDAGLVEVELVVEALPAPGEPCLRFVPAQLRVDGLGAGGSRTVSVGLESCSDVPVENIALIGASGVAGAVSGIPDRLEPGEVAQVDVIVRGTGRPGPFTGEVVVGLGAEDPIPLARLAIGGVATSEDVCLAMEPPFIDFGTVLVGETAGSDVTLTNCGDIPLLLSGGVFDADEFAFFVGAEQLDPGASTGANVNFSPASEGVRSGALAIRTDRGEIGPFAARGVGRADVVQPRGPAVELRPDSTDLGELPSGARVTTGFSICSIGDSPLRLDALVAEGAIELDSADLTGTVLPPGDCAVVTVAFVATRVPTAVGAVRVRSNARNASVALFEAFATVTDTLPDGFCLETVTPRVDTVAEAGDTVALRADFANCGDVPFVIATTEVAVIGELENVRAGGEFGVGPGSVVAPGETFSFSGSATTIDAALDGAAAWNLTVRTAEGGVATAVITVAFSAPDTGCLRPLNEVVDLGVVSVGATGGTIAEFENCGSTPLTLAEALVTPLSGSGIFGAGSPGGRVVAPGATFEIEVTFTPARAGLSVAELVVTTRDGRAISTPPLRLRGQGEVGPNEVCLRSDPPAIDLGLLAPGETASAEGLVQNCGDTEIELVDVGIGSDLPGLFVEPGVPLPIALPPGDAVPYRVILEATTPGSVGSTIVFALADGTAFNVPLRAQVVGDEDCPPPLVGAAIDPAGPFEPATAVRPGTTFYLGADFGGRDARYDYFVLDLPRGASRELGMGPGGTLSYTPTLEGTYVFGLRWETGDGCSGEDSVSVDVRARSGVGEGLRVVITWRTPGDPDELTDPGTDIDLHLARRTSRGVAWNSENDCYYANQNPSWTAPGTADDPRLLRDEVDGLGPEIIVLESPAEPVYYVGVYYFSSDDFGPSDATLRVFFDGVQIASATRRLQRTGDFWLAAAIRNLGESVELFDLPNSAGFPTTVP